MVKTLDWAERREFGRRACRVKARAFVAGYVPVPCTLLDLSEGGALIAFEQAVGSVGQTFRIEIEDSMLQAVCETRHVSGRQIGVRFARRSEGQALVMHFSAFPAGISPLPVEAVRPPLSEMARADVQAMRKTAIACAHFAMITTLVGFRVVPAGRFGRCKRGLYAAALALALGRAEPGALASTLRGGDAILDQRHCRAA